MVELRSAILTAGAADRPQFPTVQLGINYQTRLLAVNGPPPAGLLQTSDAYPITISDGTTEVVVDTRFIEYQPGYNELDVGSTWYENSVLYLDELESSGGLVIVEDQNLVTDGDTLRITALQNDFQRSGTDRITVELYPTSVAGDISDLEENEELTVSLPTRLDSDYWEDQFEDSSSVAYDDFEDSGIEPDINMLNLTVNNVSNLELNTVGIREEPDEGPAKNIQAQTGGNTINDGNDNSDNNNDNNPFSFVVVNEQRNTNNRFIVEYDASGISNFDRVEVTFDNLAGNDWADDTIANEGSSGIVRYPRNGNYRGGVNNNNYEITVEVYGSSVVPESSGSVTIQAGSEDTVEWP
jgi:hypothetical protein